MKRTKISAITLALLLVAALAAVMAAGCGSTPTTKAEITSLDPSSGPAGTQIEIVGTSFGESQGNSVVHIGVKVADVLSWTDVLVTAKVPAGLTDTVQAVSVLTPAGESNELSFLVVATPQPSQPEGHIESITPLAAMQSYEKKKGVGTAGWTFSVTKVSAADSNWKIDQGGPTKGTLTFFLLHNLPTDKVNPNWTVIDSATSFTPQKLAADGAPADLQVTLPTPTPQPQPQPQPQPKKTQQQVILDYLTSKGVDTSAVSIALVKESKTDPTWELFNLDWPAEAQIPDAKIVLHEEGGQWVVKNYGGDVSNTPGMPADLLQ